MPKPRRRRSSDAGVIRLRGFLFFICAMLPEFISALSMETGKINWPLTCCKATLSGCVALGGFLDQTISRLKARIATRNSPSNPTEAG